MKEQGKSSWRPQLVLPHDHRRNAVEKAIQVFKDHFMAVLCKTDDTFPMWLWCSLLPHAVVHLNMLRASAINPSISAFEQLHGPHNYDSHPLQFWETQLRYTSLQTTGERGANTPSLVSIWAPLGSTTGAMIY